MKSESFGLNTSGLNDFSQLLRLYFLVLEETRLKGTAIDGVNREVFNILERLPCGIKRASRVFSLVIFPMPLFLFGQVSH